MYQSNNFKQSNSKTHLTGTDWNRIKKLCTPEAFGEVLEYCESEEHAEDFEYLSNDFKGLTVNGEGADNLLLCVYYLACKNATDSAVMSFLRGIDSDEDFKCLTTGIFLDLATAQKKKTVFEKIMADELKDRRKRNRENERELRRIDREAFLATQPPYYGEKLTQKVVETILGELGVSVRLNLVTKKIELHGNTEVIHQLYSKDNIMSTLPTLILDVCKNNEVGKGQIGLGAINAYLFNLADANRYNPITEMLISHENSDESRLEAVYEILGVRDSFDRTLIRKWLIQTVAFAFADIENPVSTEGVLVLQGEQGNGKTSFFRRLAGDPLWFTEGAVLDMRNKDSIITAISGWICELGEIDSTLKKEQSALKAFITRTVDKIRLPYAAAESTMPRTTSMCGTVNPEQFLKDSTGNRRYWTIHVDRIDKRRLFALTKEEIFDMWGFVYHLYLQDREGFRLNDVENKKLEMRNRDFSEGLPYEEEVRSELDFGIKKEFWSWVSPSELSVFFQGAKAEHIGRVLTKIKKEEPEIKMIRTAMGKRYFIPICGWISQQLKKNA